MDEKRFMPVSSTKSQFLYVKKRPRSFFALQAPPGYLWSQEDSGVVQDISVNVLKEVFDKYYVCFKTAFSEKMADIVGQLNPSPHAQSSSSFWKEKKARISLEIVTELDNVGDWSQKSMFIDFFCRMLDGYIVNGYAIGIDFREVFLVPEGETPPAHFRTGIDILVGHAVEYKKMTDRLSYLVGKAIFYRYTPYFEPQHPAEDDFKFNRFIAKYYADNPHDYAWDTGITNYATPLKNYRYFKSALACFVHWQTDMYRPLRDANKLVCALTYPASVNDLRPFFERERDAVLTIVINGSEYGNEVQRQLVYEDVSRLVKETKYKSLFHIFLMTKDNLEDNLLDLVSIEQESHAPFQPLLKDAGYYLSSLSISASYRNLQAFRASLTKEWFEELSCLVEKEQPKPKKLSSGAYICAEKASENVRISKTLTRAQLKSKVRLTVSQDESTVQSQVINQQVQETQAQSSQTEVGQALSVNKSIVVSSNWSSKVDLDGFCLQLEAFGKKKLPQIREKEEQLNQSGFLTEFYLKKHSHLYFFEQLANDPHFRLGIAAKLFGVAVLESDDHGNKVTLPQYTIDYIDAAVCKHILQEIEFLQDGFVEKDREVEESSFWGKRTLHGIKTERPDPNDLFYRCRYLYFNVHSPSSIAPNFLSSALLTDDEIASIKKEQKEEIIHGVESLLKLFRPHSRLSPEEIDVLEQQLLGLIRFYFPGHFEEIQCLEKFIAGFVEHNEDNLKILLQILMNGHKSKFAHFLKLLVFLDERSLLNLFYRLHFQYALDISSVQYLLDSSPTVVGFLQLAVKTPVTQSSKDKSYFEALCCHLLLFFAQHNIDLNQFEGLWRRLHAKFLAYSGNQEAETQQLLNLLASRLMDEQGLSVAPVSNFHVFCAGLEQLLDHAMANHVLKEQIDEIKGVSLLPMDAIYALNWNGFKVITSEMRIYSGAINPVSRAYAVSNLELLEAMKTHRPGDGHLKTAVFRCLGAQHLREEIAYYRKLYQVVVDGSENESIKYLSELLCAYFVSKFTGSGHDEKINQEKFLEDFFAFLHEHHLQTNLTSQQVASHISKFISQISQIPTDEQKGVQSLWTIWQKHQVLGLNEANTSIPEIFLRKFSAKQLGYFLVTQKEKLQENLGALNQDARIAWSLIDEWCGEFNLTQTQSNLIQVYLEKLYQPMDMQTLLREVTKISSFLPAMSSFMQCNPQSSIYLMLDDFLDKKPKAHPFFILTGLFASKVVKNKGQFTKDKQVKYFLMALEKNGVLYNELPRSINLVSMLLETCLMMDVNQEPTFPLKLMETLSQFDLEEVEQIFPVLLPLINDENGLKFLNAHAHLSAVQLIEVTQFLKIAKPSALTLDLLKWIYSHEPIEDLTEISNFLNQKSEEERYCLLMLGHKISLHAGQSLFTGLKKLERVPLPELKKLARLYTLQMIKTEEELLELLSAPALSDAISEFQLKKNQEHLERHQYSSEFVKEKIAGIKLKSHDANDDVCLSSSDQEALWSDYQLLMSYMRDKPFKMMIQGVNKELSIHEMNESEFQLLFSVLQGEITKGINVHHNQLLLIALSAEALYRTTHKFPRCTQLLALLQHIHFPNNMIHEIKTGEGKSIVAALHAVLWCGAGRTVDIATENDQLAKNALEKFASFYQYLGIPHGENTVSAQSMYGEYKANGVNYSTPSNLSLFRSRMALEKSDLPKNPALIADEIDAALTSTVQFRLAASLDSGLDNAKHWEDVYRLVLEFVKEKDIFLNNLCSEEEDIENLRNYFLVKYPKKAFHDFTQKISKALLGVLIESARVAYELEEDVDYYVVKIKKKEGDYYYAAPIIASTKRPDPHVNYSEYVQQLLHTLLNHRKPAPDYPFNIEPCTETIIVSSPKNFFDYYRLNAGPIAGLTGTAGSCVELTEFYEQQGLTAFSYPTFYPDLSQNAGFIPAFGSEAHLQKTFEFVKHFRLQNPQQPILLITPSPQATEQFINYMTMRADWKIQSYHGYEEGGKSEERVIYTAGKDDFLTIANQSLARGADIDPENKNGLLVINTCTDLTSSELRQIQGRAARNGKPGQYISIIDVQTLGSATDSEEVLLEAFKAHQRNLSVQQQQERAKMRLLEETRCLLVNKLLELRKAADAILVPQFGEAASLVEQKELLSDISVLTCRAEKDYFDLLEKHNVIEEGVAQEFLEARVIPYQAILDKWFSANRFIEIQFVEPSIPIKVLKTLSPQLEGTTVAQLSAFADIFHRGWKREGHQNVRQYTHSLDQWIEVFNPYFNKQCSFKQALGEVLDKGGHLNVEALDNLERGIKTNIDKLLEEAKATPVIGTLVPVDRVKAYIYNYVETTKTQILEKKWEEVQAPTIDLPSITPWFSQVRQAYDLYAQMTGMVTLGLSFAGGPIGFIVNNFIIPKVKGIIKNMLKQRAANSGSEIAQILVGFDELSGDLSKFITGLASVTQQEEIKVGWLLDRLGPLTKNKAFLLVLTNCLKLYGKSEYIPWVQLILKALPLFEDYRDYKLEELLSVRVFMHLLQQVAHLDPALNIMENSPYLPSLQRLSQLKPEFIDQMSALSFPQVVSLLKLIAHPHFFSLMEKLPPETTLEQLRLWIVVPPEDVSTEVKHAIREMLDYQINPERVAEEGKQKLLALHKTYELTSKTLTADLKKLKPTFKKKVVPPDPVREVKPQTTFWWVKHAIFLILAASLITYCAISVSATAAAIACISIAAWVVYPFVLKQVMHWGAKLKDKIEKAFKFKEEQACQSTEIPLEQVVSGSLIKLGGSVKKAAESALPLPVADTKQGFFARAANQGKLEDSSKNTLPTVS